MAPSKRPLVDLYGKTWLGDPEAPDFSIEIDDDFIGLYAPSGETRVRWEDIAELEIDIPTANWGLAKFSQRLLATMDALQVANTNGVNYQYDTRRGQKDIEVRITTRDGEQVKGWAHKHQPLGYPEPEAQAAKAVLMGRVG